MNRADFPILKETVHGRPLVYLDNAATSQKPQVVMDAITEAYTHWNSNIHRGVHHLSQIATSQSQRAGFLLWRSFYPRGRRDHRLCGGTPFEYRAVADALCAQGGDPATYSSTCGSDA